MYLITTIFKSGKDASCAIYLFVRTYVSLVLRLSTSRCIERVWIRIVIRCILVTFLVALDPVVVVVPLIMNLVNARVRDRVIGW
jgi:hypothetical protein